MLTLLDSLPRLEVARVHAFGEQLARDSSGESFRLAGSLLTGWIAKALDSRARQMAAVDVMEGEAAIRERLLARGNLEQWLSLWENLSRSFVQTERANLDKKQTVITAFLELEGLVA